MNEPKSISPSHRKLFLTAGILLIAANLRAPVTGVAPILATLRDSFGISQAVAGALTTVPLLAFALVSPLGVILAKRYGLERSLFAALLAIAAGVLLRSQGAFVSLLFGTLVIGAGIAVGNVLLPSLVKRDLPERIVAITGLYSIAMGVAAALGSSAVVPLAEKFGWQGALLAFGVLPLSALALWAGQLRRRSPPAPATAAPPAAGARIWQASLAWQVTLFLSINSTIYYVMISYLPSVLKEAGVAASEAGSLHGLMQLASGVPGLLLGGVVSRLRDQRTPALAGSLLSGVGILGLIYWPAFAALWTILFGFGSGAAFILALSFIGLRTKNERRSAELSGMAQCFGYLLAAAGPLVAGMLFEWTQGWTLPLLVCAGLTIVCGAFGWLAGRGLQIE